MHLHKRAVISHPPETDFFFVHMQALAPVPQPQATSTVTSASL